MTAESTVRSRFLDRVNSTMGDRPAESRRDGERRDWPPELQGSQLARFTQIVSAVRVTMTAIALVLVLTNTVERTDGLIIWAVVVTMYNAFRLFQPLQSDDDIAGQARVLVEVGIHAIAVTSTGAWESPFVYPLVTAIIVAGFARGIWPAIRIASATAIAVIVADSVGAGRSTGWQTDAQWTLFLLLVGLMAGYAKRITGDARRSHSLAMTRVEHLADANRLLSSLHTVAQVLPASLDLEEVIDSTMVRLRDLFAFDVAALLLFDETDGGWTVARWDGFRLPRSFASVELPSPAQRVALDRSVWAVRDLVSHGGGFGASSKSGLYGALTARESLVGILVLEANAPSAFGDREVQLLSGFMEAAALSIDNAQVFSRLRTVGADEERTRIARDLHDRIGQSLAYVAFELDRLLKTHEKGGDLGPPLRQLRSDVRGVVAEVRDTLYDLRTDVSEQNDFAQTMNMFLERVQERSGLRTSLISNVDGRLPLLPERELWRIAQEAVINVERHAKATSVSVNWRTDGSRALLEIIDDGVGFPQGKVGRLDSYGILGMRERAASVGATMEISGTEGRGTVVRCRLDAA